MSVQRPVQRRMEVILFCLLSAFVVFIVRAYQLQVVLADEHLAKAQWGVESVSRYEAPRGAIMDRDGELLASSAPAVTLAYDPRLLLTDDAAHLDEVVALIAGFERFDPADLDAWRAGSLDDVPRFALLERGVAPGLADELIARLRDIGVRSVFRQEGFRRMYPNGPMAGRTIGFLDGYGSAGVAGVERAVDEYLRGATVEVPVARDALREPYMLGAIPDLGSAAGATVYLTLDRELQGVAEQALRDTMEQYGAQAGVVVVTRVDTGEILVMASAPDFDPNGDAAADSAGWTNPAIANAYEPGSTAKMLTFAAALEDDVIEYDTEFDCEGGAVRVDRYRIRDRHCDGTILAWEAIRDSSNIGALKMGLRLPQDRHRAYLLAFGLGERLDVGLPGEVAGVVPGLDRPWAESQHATISYGYGFSVTPLQLNVATAAIANGGVRMQPYLVDRVVDPSGAVILQNGPRAIGSVVSPQTAELVTSALETVVGPDGTARLAGVPGHQVAGKTGTARLLGEDGQYAENAYLAAFTGFAPSRDPRVAITVIIERPDPALGYYGGIVAAPVFAAVARRALELDGLVVGDVEPGAPVEHAASAETTEGLADAPAPGLVTGGHVVPDFTGMLVRDALRASAESGVAISVEGVGRVATQWPPAGTPASPDTAVVLTLAEVR